MSPFLRSLAPPFVAFLFGSLLGPSLAKEYLPRASSKAQDLTAEQLEILSHMSIVHLDDGKGNLLETIRISVVSPPRFAQPGSKRIRSKPVCSIATMPSETAADQTRSQLGCAGGTPATG